MSNSPFPEISDEALQVGFRKATEFRNLLILASVVLAIVSLLFSMMVLYVAIVQLDINAIGIMLGLSNILLAATAYALIQRPRSSDSSDVLS
jgi:hypothetical protein